jgi:TonB family protein
MRRIGCVIACLAVLTLSAWAQVPGSQADDSNNDLQHAGTPPRLLHADPVNYPADASLARTRHTCVVSVVIGKDGKLRSAQLENTQPSPFDASALESVRSATFSPATRDGQAVGARAQVWVEFRGDGQPALPSIDPGPGFERPRAKVSPIPEYTTEARKQGIQGNVLLSFVVTEDGAVTDILVLRHLGGGLDDQAVKTVQQWRFDPATLDGEAVPYRIKAAMSFNFR